MIESLLNDVHSENNLKCVIETKYWQINLILNVILLLAYDICF